MSCLQCTECPIKPVLPYTCCKPHKTLKYIAAAPCIADAQSAEHQVFSAAYRLLCTSKQGRQSGRSFCNIVQSSCASTVHAPSVGTDCDVSVATVKYLLAGYALWFTAVGCCTWNSLLPSVLGCTANNEPYVLVHACHICGLTPSAIWGIHPPAICVTYDLAEADL